MKNGKGKTHNIYSCIYPFLYVVNVPRKDAIEFCKKVFNVCYFNCIDEYVFVSHLITFDINVS